MTFYPTTFTNRKHFAYVRFASCCYYHSIYIFIIIYGCVLVYGCTCYGFVFVCVCVQERESDCVSFYRRLCAFLYVSTVDIHFFFALRSYHAPASYAHWFFPFFKPTIFQFFISIFGFILSGFLKRKKKHRNYAKNCRNFAIWMDNVIKKNGNNSMINERYRWQI